MLLDSYSLTLVESPSCECKLMTDFLLTSQVMNVNCMTLTEELNVEVYSNCWDCHAPPLINKYLERGDLSGSFRTNETFSIRWFLTTDLRLFISRTDDNFAFEANSFSGGPIINSVHYKYHLRKTINMHLNGILTSRHPLSSAIIKVVVIKKNPVYTK